MKRALLVLAVLGLFAGPLWADFIVIRVNLGNNDAPAGGVGGGAPGGGPGGAPGAPPGFGPGGGIGPGGFGMAGGGIGPGGFGMAGGGIGPGGGRGPGGFGMAGGGIGPGGFGMAGGGIGPGGFGPGGFGMAGGGIGPGGFGPGGFGPGGPGNAGGAGLGGIGPGGPAGNQGPDSGSQDLRGNWFVTVVEADVTFQQAMRNNLSNGYFLTTKFTPRLELDPTTSIPGEISLQLIKFPKMDKFMADKKKQFADEPLRFAEWMLQHWNFPTEEGKFDMQKEFERYIDELSNRGGLDAGQKARVDALRLVREDLKKHLSDPTSELEQIKNLPGVSADYKVTRTPHYLMLHLSRDERLANSKLKRLERTYAAFFYWFALSGQPLKQPEKALITIMPEDRDKFQVLHKVLDSLPMINDGFFSNLDNVAILSKYRTDAPYEQFQTLASEFEKGLSAVNLDLDKVLTGKVPPQALRGPGAISTTDLAKAKILGLASRAAQEEGELATATFEGVQQLVAATDLLPRRVHVPMAIRFGLASFFETPKSCSELDYPSIMTGVGGNHWVYLRFFKKLANAEKGGSLSFERGAYWDKTVKIDKLNMLKILTDQGFDALPKAKAEDREVIRAKARAEAWALTHFLLRQKLPQTVKFFNELGQLPRDMDLSPEIVEAVFARSFDVGDSNNPDRIDADRMAELERSWRDFMNFQTLELTEGQLTDNSIDPNTGGRENRPGGPGR